MPAKRTEPSRSLCNPADGFKYTPSVSTDLAKRFKAMKQASLRAAKQTTAPDPRQRDLELEGHSHQAQVVPLRLALTR